MACMARPSSEVPPAVPVTTPYSLDLYATVWGMFTACRRQIDCYAFRQEGSSGICHARNGI